jgi:HSP20 family molecular chaperone IbpA
MAQTPVYTYPRRILSERRLGGFERSFTFPMEVNPDGMKASLTNGLLRIVVPKKKDAVSESRRIRVQ